MRMTAALTCLLLVTSACTYAAQGDFLARRYVSADGQSLLYRIHTPDSMGFDEVYPLVLFLHGAGERGDDNESQLIHGVRPLLAYSRSCGTPVIIVAPQCPKGQQWVDVPWSADAHTMPETPSASMRLVIELLKETLSTLPVDPRRVYVTGLSMGGFGTWDIVQRMPDVFAAALPVCGGVDTFYVDGKETWRTTQGVSQRSEYMIMSLEVGPWAGDIARAALPDHLLVDYVRVSQMQ